MTKTPFDPQSRRYPPVTPVGMGKSPRGVELTSIGDLDAPQIAASMTQVVLAGCRRETLTPSLAAEEWFRGVARAVDGPSDRPDGYL
jgi:hypothetical protein